MLAYAVDFTTIIAVKNNRRPQPGLGPRDGSPDLAQWSGAKGRILDTLRANVAGTSLAALSETTGLHVNTLRGHLDELVDAGTVSRTAAPAVGRGRPAWLYVADGPDPAPGNEYAGLATTLAIGLEQSSEAPRDLAVSAGQEWGRELARDVPAEPDGRRRVVRVLERMGFAPRSDASGPIRLTRCPLLKAARAHPDVVCGVHLGIVQGVLAESGARSTTAELHAFAAPGACLLSIDAVDGDDRDADR